MKRMLVSAALVALILGSASLSTSAQTNDGRYDNDYQDLARIVKGFQINPVHLNLVGKDLRLVGLGSYLVNAVAACNECHSNPTYLPGGNPFMGQPTKINTAGFLAGGQAFGPFISRNITPQNGKPAGLSWPQFLNVMRTGVDPEQLHPQISPLLQVMPWPVFRHMNDHDLRAIYEYLRAIPSIKAEP